MQKDRVVDSVSSVLMNEEGKNIAVITDNIKYTIIYSENESGELIETKIDGGYLDIGLIDTMKDLFVNFIGAVCFSAFGYLYIKNREQFGFVNHFIPLKKSK